MSGDCEGVCTSGARVYAWVRSSPRGIRWGEWVQKPLIFMRFHGVLLGNQREIWSKQHNGKVRTLVSAKSGSFPLSQAPGQECYEAFLTPMPPHTLG
jgi:hypothetical protein